jgi:hypothetical protein
MIHNGASISNTTLTIPSNKDKMFTTSFTGDVLEVATAAPVPSVVVASANLATI